MNGGTHRKTSQTAAAMGVRRTSSRAAWRLKSKIERGKKESGSWVFIEG